MIAAVASIAALALFVAACGAGGTGPRDDQEGPAVSGTVKRELKPCSGDDYPVDVTYGDLTPYAIFVAQPVKCVRQ